MHAVARHAAAAYLLGMGIDLLRRQQGNVAYALYAGKILLQVLDFEIGMEFVAADQLRTGEQPLHAMQHLGVGLHALIEIAEQFAHPHVEFGAGIAFGIGVRSLPE